MKRLFSVIPIMMVLLFTVSCGNVNVKVTDLRDYLSEIKNCDSFEIEATDDLGFAKGDTVYTVFHKPYKLYGKWSAIETGQKRTQGEVYQWIEYNKMYFSTHRIGMDTWENRVSDKYSGTNHYVIGRLYEIITGILEHTVKEEKVKEEILDGGKLEEYRVVISPETFSPGLKIEFETFKSDAQWDEKVFAQTFGNCEVTVITNTKEQTAELRLDLSRNLKAYYGKYPELGTAGQYSVCYRIYNVNKAKDFTIPGEARQNLQN